MKIVFIGAGNVATHLAWALKENGHEIIQVYSRTQLSAETLAQQLNTDFCISLDKLKQADMYIYALSDNAIETIVNQVNIYSGIHIHTAGSINMNIFERKFEKFGVFYPLQTFSKDKKIDLSQVPIFVEGNSTDTTKTLLNLAKTLTNKPLEANSSQRIQLHIAAVFACNFSNYLYSIAADLLLENNLPFDILHPLIIETASKIQTLSPYEAQTGPARRNDTVTIKKQLDKIGNENYKKIYSEMSEQISKKYRKEEDC